MFVPVIAHAQERTSDLSFKNGGWSYSYYIGEQQVPFKTFMERLEENEQTASMFKSGKNLGITGTVISGIGAYCFGYDLGGRLAGEKGNNIMLIGGGGVMAGGLIMALIGKGKMKKALRLYKDENKETSMMLNISSSELGISLYF
jgi:hypothetical protein